LPHAAVPLLPRCSRIQTSSPHRVRPLHVQVCAPFSYGQFSNVSPVFICGPHLPRCTARPSCGPLLPRPAIILPQIGVLALDVARRRQTGCIAPDAPPRPAAPPPLLEPLPAGSRLHNPSQPCQPRHLPSRLSHPAVPLPSPRCAPFPPLPPHLPAPERRPPPTMPRAAARPGPCSRDAPRGLPPLFPPCLARWLPPDLRFPAGHSSIQSNSGSGLFPSVLCGRARPTSSPFQGVSRPGDYNSQRPPRDGGSDVARPRPSTRPRPRPPKSAREVGGAKLGLRGRSRRDAQDSGARAWREASGTSLAGLQGCSTERMSATRGSSFRRIGRLQRRGHGGRLIRPGARRGGECAGYGPLEGAGRRPSEVQDQVEGRRRPKTAQDRICRDAWRDGTT